MTNHHGLCNEPCAAYSVTRTGGWGGQPKILTTSTKILKISKILQCWKYGGGAANYNQYLEKGLGAVAVPIIVHGNHSTYICHIQLKIILIDRYWLYYHIKHRSYHILIGKYWYRTHIKYWLAMAGTWDCKKRETTTALWSSSLEVR